MHLSKMAENLRGSEIIKLAADIRQKVAEGKQIYNFTIGDFDAKIFPIPKDLEKMIIYGYRDNHTNYPTAEGIVTLRSAIARFIRNYQGLEYPISAIQVAAGARPIIYSIFATIIDPGDKVIYPMPSWNNSNYCDLFQADSIIIETLPENNFMPMAAEIAPHLKGAALLSLCSPQNPTGTVFSKENLSEICDLVLAENKRRGPNEKPLYVLYDQIYGLLTYNDTKHHDPVSLRPEMREYTIFSDGISKCFAATGVRLGWAFGPEHIIEKMKTLLSHIGAWAPKPEQFGVGEFLLMHHSIDEYLDSFKSSLQRRLNDFHQGIQEFKQNGYSVDSIAPQAAIYLALKFDLTGKRTESGNVLTTTADVTEYILNEAQLAIVPFSAFGASKDSSWYRLSVGTSRLNDIYGALRKLRLALIRLS